MFSNLQFCPSRSRYSDWLRAGRPRGRSSCPGRVKNFLFSASSRLALGSTQPPIQWISWALSPGYSDRGVKLTTPLHLVPRSRKCGSIHPLPIRLHGVVLNSLSTGSTLSYIRCPDGRSEWSRGLRHEISSSTRTLGSWVRIPLEAWMSAFILCFCCPL
jgi:hypothetical protein